MNRRDFIVNTSCMAAVAGSLGGKTAGDAEKPFIMTVNGPLSSDALGPTLSHEHVLVDFIGAAEITPDRYDPEEAFSVILPYLKDVKEAGCLAMAECTPAYLGRDPRLLSRLSRATGMNFLTNTGYYGAAKDKYLPAHAWDESADKLASRWIREWEEGIGDTGIKPGFIKTAVDPGPVSEIDGKLIRAAAMTHWQTGLTIMSHTGPAVPAFEQIEILKEEGVHPSAWIWTHAQGAKDFDDHFRAADAGAWIAFDGLKPGSFDRYANFLLLMRQRNQLDQVLLSHDAGWYSPDEPGGGDFRGYNLLFDEFLPFLSGKGLTEDEITLLMEKNPAEAFTVKKRRR